MSKVLITGATSVIGEALAKRYASNACEVIACGRNQEKLNRLALDPLIDTLAFDITDPSSIEKQAQSISDLDILILNAGDCEYIDDAKHFDGALFARIITTNLTAMGYLLEYLLPKVKSGGQLVLVSSSATILPLPRAEAYGASKAGVDYLAKVLSIDLAKENIGVTLVHPGFIKTPLTDKNTFTMPCLLSSEEAAKRIYQCVKNKRSYLHFPKRFTYLLKLLSCIPSPWWRKLVSRSVS